MVTAHMKTEAFIFKLVCFS